MSSHSNNTNRGIESITEQGTTVLEVPDEKECFSELTLASISKLANVFKRIDKRMKREGFSIQCGKIVKNENA